MKLKFIFSLIVFLFLAICTVDAQPGPPGDPDVPITGVEILLVAGGALGLRKIISSKKKQ